MKAVNAMQSRSRRFSGAGLRCAVALGAALVGHAALADKIKHPTAVFAGLDKITGRIISFDVAIDETVQFGSLQITPRICYTRPATEAPLTDGFTEIDEVNLANEYKRIFSGWMFAASPGLNGVEHPVYDVWLTDCKGGTQVIVSPPEQVEAAQTPPPPNAAAKPDKPPVKLRRVQPLDPAVNPAADAPIDVAPPPGLRPAERQQRRPSIEPFQGGRDPAGN